MLYFLSACIVDCFYLQPIDSLNRSITEFSFLFSAWIDHFFCSIRETNELISVDITILLYILRSIKVMEFYLIISKAIDLFASLLKILL